MCGNLIGIRMKKMKRRSFLKGCVAVLFSPLALVKGKETPKVVIVDDGWNPNPGPNVLGDYVEVPTYVVDSCTG